MDITPNSLAALIGGSVDGDGDIVLNDFARIEEAKCNCISFIANPKYEQFIYTTEAGAVLVRNDFYPDRKVRPTLIRVEDPYATLAMLLEYVDKISRKLPEGIESPSFIDPSALVADQTYVGAFSYIGRNASIARGARIYPQVYIGDGVRIGENTVIYPGVKIYEKCIVGANCTIHSGVVIGADGFGFAPHGEVYEKIPQIGNVVIEDNVEVGANTTIDRATFGSTVVGRGTKLDNLIQVAHNVRIGKNNVIASQTGIAGSTQIGDGNRCGGQVGFAGHIKIGDRNEFGAQSGIPNNVGSGKRLIGYPAVDARAWAKSQVYIKNLEKLFKQS